MTSQVNVVNPGGQAQVAHTDYHLGFMSVEQAQAYPMHVHALSPALTLQGAVAHNAMPVETGPTMYLPYSQLYHGGYVACHKREFVDYFDEHYVQLPLDKGDAVFFNPGLYHGAGTNRSRDVRRMANLLQVSSPFGRAMESVDRSRSARRSFQYFANGGPPVPATRSCAASWLRLPKGMRFRPTSIAINRSGTWRRNPKPAWSGGR